ncbi:YfeC-like transcriptional regulator [Aurantibacillus circumpalustris]|uniref:YfeC-like transcriptional regulator n=1 Tax=Aurantibacillus circumpalustris TaxID=3036359 RepID=UPI00295A6C32|nr:YfeC-like transcriptional regulator [Aurantibacillus circumpalustris]
MAELSIKQKKEWAKTLYVHQQLSQKETAEKVNVSAKTINQWVNKESWDTLRVSLVLTKEQQLRNIYAQLNELTTFIQAKAEGKRFANSSEADTISKLSKAAKDLETETGISEIIETFKLFTNWLKSFDLPKAQELLKLQDDFIASRIK